MIDELGKRLSASTLAARLGMGINQVYAHAQELGRSFSHLSSRCAEGALTVDDFHPRHGRFSRSVQKIHPHLLPLMPPVPSLVKRD